MDRQRAALLDWTARQLQDSDRLIQTIEQVLQAHRQPGSAFKPIVYSGAIEKLNLQPSSRSQALRYAWGSLPRGLL